MARGFTAFGLVLVVAGGWRLLAVAPGTDPAGRWRRAFDRGVLKNSYLAGYDP
jgi:hypothetical protein